MTRHSVARYQATLSTVATATRTSRLEIVAVSVDLTQSTVQLCGEVDLESSELVGQALRDEVAKGHRFIRLDLSRLTFLDCAGLRALAAGHNLCLANRGTLVLTGLTSPVARLLSMTELDQALFIADGPGDRLPTRHLSAVPNT